MDTYSTRHGIQALIKGEHITLSIMIYNDTTNIYHTEIESLYSSLRNKSSYKRKYHPTLQHSPKQIMMNWTVPNLPISYFIEDVNHPKLRPSPNAEDIKLHSAKFIYISNLNTRNYTRGRRRFFLVHMIEEREPKTKELAHLSRLLHFTFEKLLFFFTQVQIAIFFTLLFPSK